MNANQDTLNVLEEKILDLEFKQLKKQFGRELAKVSNRATPSKKCTGSCRPTSCYKNGRQMVMSLTGTSRYGREEVHFPCGSPGCNAKALCDAEARDRKRRGLNY
jgi:hypothetical protein